MTVSPPLVGVGPDLVGFRERGSDRSVTVSPPLVGPDLVGFREAGSDLSVSVRLPPLSEPDLVGFLERAPEMLTRTVLSYVL